MKEIDATLWTDIFSSAFKIARGAMAPKKSLTKAIGFMFIRKIN